jgi:isopenicillin N synthase-like dioxygenase
MDGFRGFLDEFYQVSTSFRRRDEVCGKAHVRLSNMKSSSSFEQKCYKLSVAVLSSLALTLGLPKDYFVDALESADPQLRLLHYMPIHRSEIEAEGHARIIPHTDFGLCTILFQDQVGGLEVDPFHTGKFLPATPMKGTCVINVADLLQRLSNDRLRSTLHRVTTPQLNKEKSESIGENGMLPARYSTAFFVHPSADVEIVPILGDGETVSKYEKVNAGQWRTYNTAKNYSNLLQASA